MYNGGLILEGGGMRGVYTCGVIDCFLDNDIKFSSVYGVSAGAGHGCSYLSGQRGRAFKANTDYLKGYDYAGFKTFLKTGSLFNMDLIYNRIPNELLPFDGEAFDKNPMRFFVSVTSCETGKAEFTEITDYKSQADIIRASGSLPVISPAVKLGDKMYYDGGIADSIPVRKSVEDGNLFNVAVLTRDKEYRKTPEHIPYFFRRKFAKKYPKLLEAMNMRHIVYNETLEFIDSEEKAGRRVVIRPKAEVKVGRADTDIEKLKALYEDGYRDATDSLGKISQLFHIGS